MLPLDQSLRLILFVGDDGYEVKKIIVPDTRSLATQKKKYW